ncbi:MAG: metallophosphoesterase, partial [Acidobacteriota bacterium]
GHWIGGSTTLIQVGDLLDRGLDLREVMDLLMKLQREARKADGEVVCLLGNHEGMNLLGLVRDVNPEVYAAFADRRSQERRDKAFAAMTRCWETRAELLEPGPEDPSEEIRAGLFGPGLEDPSEEIRAEWMARHPLGKLEYLEALGPKGLYGKWLRNLPTAVRRDDTVFVHAGLSPALQGQDIDGINLRVAAELHRFDRCRATLVSKNLVLPTASVNEVSEVATAILLVAPGAEGKRGRRLQALAEDLEGAAGIGGWYLVHQDGPLWFRGAALWNEEESTDQIGAILDQLKVDRMVIGHTVTRDGNIKSRFGGRVLAIDTGMLSEFYEGGRPSALEIIGDTVTAIYPGERYLLVDGEWQAIVSESELEVAVGG